MQNSKWSSWLALATVFTILAGTGVRAQGTGANAQKDPKKPDYPLALADQGYFFVNGHYVVADSTGAHVMARQMYVSYKIPTHVTQRYPIVMIHGAAQTGTNFDATPDGREGWADFFVARGYKVYVIDQPGRGRSAYIQSVYGPLSTFTAEQIEQLFTAPEDYNTWPQAHLHTQWPDGGHIGDPVFNQFYASQVPLISNDTLTQRLNQDAGAALLDSIGPAIVMTHSQSGSFGWLIADKRPRLVKGIVALEPSGPPFYSVAFTGPPDWFADGAFSKPWGITAIPLTYAPAVSDPSQLHHFKQPTPDRSDLVRCWLQSAPVHRLPRLAGIPIVIVTSEASYHASYDHCTAKYLKQAGVPNTFVRLEERGIHGNAHMMFLEKNNLQIARLVQKLIENRILSASQSVAVR